MFSNRALTIEVRSGQVFLPAFPHWGFSNGFSTHEKLSQEKVVLHESQPDHFCGMEFWRKATRSALDGLRETTIKNATDRIEGREGTSATSVWGASCCRQIRDAPRKRMCRDVASQVRKFKRPSQGKVVTCVSER